MTFSKIEAEHCAIFAGTHYGVRRRAVWVPEYTLQVCRSVHHTHDSLSRIEFASTMAKANEALDAVSSITKRVANGEGSLGKLVANDSLHNGLVATNAELQLLLDDLQMHPWKYVQVNLIGRKQKSEFSKKDLKRLRNIIADEIEAQEGGSSNND